MPEDVTGEWRRFVEIVNEIAESIGDGPVTDDQMIAEFQTRWAGIRPIFFRKCQLSLEKITSSS